MWAKSSHFPPKFSEDGSLSSALCIPGQKLPNKKIFPVFWQPKI